MLNFGGVNPIPTQNQGAGTCHNRQTLHQPISARTPPQQISRGVPTGFGGVFLGKKPQGIF